MRSSIACARCRRSKVKCVNNGIGTTCRACETTGRECTYPVPIPGGGGGGGVRRESAESRQPGESVMQHEYAQIPRKPRAKKLPTPTNVTTKESMRALVDALDLNVLTPQVWIELFEIWQLHYSTDLPFIHPPTFLRPLRQMQQAPVAGDFASQSGSPTLPPGSHLTLLAFLALTARFHEKLVAHHSPPSSSRPSNPLIACQYYAAACKARLAGNSGDGLGLADLDRSQALAMLALHDWGNCSGSKSWISLGVAIRYAQILGLQYQTDLDDEPQSRAGVVAAKAPYAGSRSSRDDIKPGVDSSQAFIEEEIKRRIFWGLFIMDRYLSGGKYRPQMLHLSDIHLQLPSSERSFLFGDRVRTELLVDGSEDPHTRVPDHSRNPSLMQGSSNGDSASTPRNSSSHHEDDERLGKWETGSDEGIVSRYIKAIDLYGRIIQWSCGGGRRRERYAPWDTASTWYTMHYRLTSFIEKLPRDLVLTTANIQAHISSRTSTPFVLLHAVLLLCKIMLHREYMPFIPLRCSKPEGPLDPPIFPPEQVQPGFWEYSATENFRASRQLIDLAQTCHEWNVLPQTPIVGFAIYIAGLVGVYAINFPWMDPNGYMCKKVGNGQRKDESGANAARQALSLVAFMRRRLKMADGWFKTINRIHRYYVRIKKDFHRNIMVLGGPSTSPGPLSIKEGGAGGGLQEFQMIEATLQEFGSLEDADVEMTDAHEQGEGKAGSSMSVKSVGYGMHGDTPESGHVRHDRWNAINSVSGLAQSVEGVPTTNGYQQSVRTPSTTSPAATAPIYRSQYGNATTSPLISPPFAQGQLPPYPPHQHAGQALQASASLQMQMQAPPQPPMTAEQTDAWLIGLDTPFGGDDLTAFVEGKDWQSWALEAQRPFGVGGWLSDIWTGNMMP